MEKVYSLISQYRTYSNDPLLAQLQKETESMFTRRVSLVGLGVKITFVDIEVYRNDSVYGDNSVHMNERQMKKYCGHMYIHRYGKEADSTRSLSGVDFCWSNTEGQYYSWLLRGVEIEEDGKTEYFQGPMNVLEAIQKQTQASYDEIESQEWKIVYGEASIPFAFTTRINLGKTVDPKWKNAKLRLVDVTKFHGRHYKNCSFIVADFIREAKERGLAKDDAFYLCRHLLEYTPKVVKNIYKQKMLTDFHTSQVYFSEWLQKDFPKVFRELSSILQSCNIPLGVLKNTKDYWCRDYMPIPLGDGRFLKYQYNPDYLRNKPADRQYITDSAEVCAAMGIAPDVVTDIIIDGGNVIRCDDAVIMTEKVLYENPGRDVVRELESLFGCKVILLPWDRYEKYGHADGIVRYIGEGRVMMTNYWDYDPKMADKMFGILSEHFEVVKLQYSGSSHHEDSWAYINWLQTKDVIIVPAYGEPEDDEAVSQIESALPSYRGKIFKVRFNEITKKGGGVNCVSWNI